MEELRQVRRDKRLTQSEAAAYLGVSLRSYKTYETDAGKVGTSKYQYLTETLAACETVDETHGILTLDEIRAACAEVFAEYPVKYCILFGSYARGTAKATSDVDLLVSTPVTGLRFFGMAERLRLALCKEVDLLGLRQLERNPALTDEILSDGVKVYAQHQK